MNNCIYNTADWICSELWRAFYVLCFLFDKNPHLIWIAFQTAKNFVRTYEQSEIYQQNLFYVKNLILKVLSVEKP